MSTINTAIDPNLYPNDQHAQRRAWRLALREGRLIPPEPEGLRDERIADEVRRLSRGSTSQAWEVMSASPELQERPELQALWAALQAHFVGRSPQGEHAQTPLRLAAAMA